MLDDDRRKAVTTVRYLAHSETLKHRPCRSHAVNLTMPTVLWLYVDAHCVFSLLEVTVVAANVERVQTASSTSCAGLPAAA